MQRVLWLAPALLLLTNVSPASADLRPDSHAPLGVMGDHTHEQGEVMLSYRYARMHMRGSRDGSGDQSTREVLRGFPVAPFRMDTEMHMFGIMVAPSDRVTLMAMLPFVRKDMDHRTRMGQRFTTRTQGIGDLTLSALVPLWSADGHRLHLNAGLGLPTGSITKRDDTPAGRVRLPYPMQLGSGSVDTLPGLTYAGQAGDWSWGAQGLATIRLHRNREGYRRGHGYELSGWVARRLLPWLSASLRLDWNDWDDFSGADDELVPTLVPTADPERRGGERLDVLVGVNLGVAGGHRLALEVGLPVYQSLNGPQLETDVRAMIGWQLAF